MGAQTSLEISETTKIRAGISHLPKSGVLFILRVGPEASESIRAVSQAGLSVTCWCLQVWRCLVSVVSDQTDSSQENTFWYR